MKKNIMKLSSVKITLFTILLFALYSTITACGSKLSPFAISPENSLKVDIVDQSLKNVNENHKMYEEYYAFNLYNFFKDKGGDISEETVENYKKLKGNRTDKEFENQMKQNAINGDKVFTLKVAYRKADDAEKFDKGFVKVIQDYLGKTRMNQGEYSMALYPEFSKQDPAAKVKEYMDKEKIVIKDMDLPNTFVSKDLMTYPFKFTYRYVLKGTVNGKAFEKEVVQDFFLGWEDDSKGNSTDTFYGVKDVVSDSKPKK